MERQDEVLGVDTETEEQPSVTASCVAVGQGSCYTESVSVLLQARQQCSSNIKGRFEPGNYVSPVSAEYK